MTTTPLSPEELLAQASWLRRLAQSLVAGEDAAEDLVQETWLAALRRPPRAGPARPWLARVARRLASNLRRAEGRRREHEAGASRPETAHERSSPVEELEAQRLLADCVLRLEEPLRSAIVLHYLRGHDSNEIGRIQGAPAGTVRWRLKRALELLRADLDRRSGGDGRQWCSALAALLPERVGRASAPPGATGTAVTGSKAGAYAALAVTGVLVLSAAHALVQGGDGARREFVRSAPQSEPRVSSVAPAELTRPVVPDEPVASIPALVSARIPAPSSGAPAPRRRATIRGSLQIARTDERLTEALTIRLRTGDLSIRDTVVSAPDGSFTSVEEFPRGYVLASVLYPAGDVADEYEALFDPTSGDDWNVRVRWPTFVRMRTVDRGGNPLRGVDFSLSSGAGGIAEVASKTRANGELRIDGLDPGLHALVLQRGFAARELRLHVRRGPNELGDVVVECAERVAEIRGEIKGTRGCSILLVDRAGNPLAWARTTTRGQDAPMEFVLEGVPIGDYLLVPLCSDGHRFEPESMRVSPPETRAVFEAVGAREVLEARWPEEVGYGGELLARVRGRWMAGAQGLPLAEIERWIALAEGHRPAAGAPPETGALDVRLEPGWGHAFLFVEAGRNREFPWFEGVAGRPLEHVEVVADGVCIATSDASGLALGALAGAPDALAFRSLGWRVHSSNEDGALTVVEMTRE